MTRALVHRLPLFALGVAAAAALGGCPLPQPLAEVYEGGVVTPPRFVSEQTTPPEARVLVATSCPGAVSFLLSALVSSPETTYPVEARWFVDYDPTDNAGVYGLEALAIGGGTTTAVTRFDFAPPTFDPASSTVHVVEVVISNGFRQLGDAEAPLPNRSARSGYETQVYRWVFQYVEAGGSCGDDGAP